ncbi:MAG: FAD binding domain-containing protein [Ignavibacteriaceae bacterium]|nr:FAD binding domain-containing protein [Ignavibacteriaceae bacterium]
MKFEYHQPKNLKEAGKYLLLNNSIPFSGGTDILALMKDGIVNPDHVVNLKTIDGLSDIKFETGKGLSIGALVKIKEISQNQMIAENFPVLKIAASEIASPQLRNMGTVGGNLCQRPRCMYFRDDFDCIRKGGGTCYAFEGFNKYHCIIGGGPCYIVHPSDLAVALLALDAAVIIYSDGKQKQIPIDDFYILPESDAMSETILKPGEFVTGIFIPELKSEARSTYFKFKERDVWDFAIVSVAAIIRKNNGIIEWGSFAFGGVAPKPWLDNAFNKSIAGIRVASGSIENVVTKAFDNAQPLQLNSYKIPLVRNILRRVITQLSA